MKRFKNVMKNIGNYAEYLFNNPFAFWVLLLTVVMVAMYIATEYVRYTQNINIVWPHFTYFVFMGQFLFYVKFCIVDYLVLKNNKY